MQVVVKLFSFLRNGRAPKLVLETAPQATPLDIMRMLAIQPEEVGLVIVNGKYSIRDHILHDGDQLSLMPVLGGG